MSSKNHICGFDEAWLYIRLWKWSCKLRLKHLAKYPHWGSNRDHIWPGKLNSAFKRFKVLSSAFRRFRALWGVLKRFHFRRFEAPRFFQVVRHIWLSIIDVNRASYNHIQFSPSNIMHVWSHIVFMKNTTCMWFFKQAKPEKSSHLRHHPICGKLEPHKHALATKKSDQHTIASIWRPEPP